MTNITPKRLACVAAAYLLTATLYFTPVSLPHKLCVPLAILVLAAAALRLPISVCCAMGFSALGDYFGTCGLFLPQMGAFALAHVALIGAFVGLRRRATSTRSAMQTAPAILTSIAAAGLALTFIIPHAPQGVVQYGAAAYTVVICGMMCMALLQCRWLFALGAVLFVVSDSVLAWNRFVAPLPAINYLIMVPYYMGQFLLFLGFCQSYRTAPKR